MLHDLNEDQRALAELMSQISEKGFSAGWMNRVEFDLWNIVTGGSPQYGRHIVTESELHQLRSLAGKCGCWIVFDDEKEETAVDLKTWKQMVTP